MKGLVVILCQALIVNVLVAQSDPKDWTPKDIIHTDFVRSAVFSPNNEMVVWSKRKAVKDKDRFASDLYLTRINQKKDSVLFTIQLTNSDENDYNAFFSDDSETIYFLSGREKGKKLWSLSIYGGEAQAVHTFKNGISAAKLLNDSTIIFRSNEGKSLYELELEEKKDNVVVVEDTTHWKPNRLYTYSIKEKSIMRATNNNKPVRSYSTSPNGDWLIYGVTQSTDYNADAQPDPKYYLQNLRTSEKIEILSELDYPAFSFQFTQDNLGFYFISETGSDPKWNGAGIFELYYYDLNAKTFQKVDLDWELGIAGGIQVMGNDVVATLANRAYIRLRHYTKQGSNWTGKDLNLGDKKDRTRLLAAAENGSKILYQYSTTETLPTFHVSNYNSGNLEDEVVFTKLNSSLKKKSITKSEVITWSGYNDEEVTGLLYYPEDYNENETYPLVLSIHGGPAGVDLDQWTERWSTYPNILAQRGSFVLKPNYHGSSNHGLAFVESIKMNYYEPEMEDILKGIEKLNREGKIDMDKLGVMGWSNGAIIATMLTVRYPDMFKVACPGAGDVNWTSDYGTCRFGVNFDQSYFGGAPWDDVDGKFYNENYIIKSPLFELEKVKTPTIIFHGSEDRAVPRDQGWEYYRALQQVGATPVRFLWFPGQPHGLQKITHQLRKMEEELKWIDTYLFEKPDTTNQSFKEDSPLASLISRSSAKKHNFMYGDMYNGSLIPETVKSKSDTIFYGKFEITNAQYAQFETTYEYPVTQGNMPVQVSYSQAENYAKWLCELTGRNYRLPTSSEAKKLHKKALKIAKKENTLNRWAGYELTIDELKDLNKKIEVLNTTLIEEVGSSSVVEIDGAKLYDIGGNVAEYCSDGSLYGYSAYDFVDPHSQAMAESGHVGFRVILTQKN